MAAKTLVALTVAALIAAAAASCTTDADCPSSYCVNYHGPPPYSCHGCFDYCCLTDADCAGKCTTGSYCMYYPGKTYPYFCHVPAGGSCNITATAAPTTNPLASLPLVGSGNGVECYMCQKLLPYVGTSECSSKCESWWPFVRSLCSDACDEMLKVASAKDVCAAAGYCSL